MSAIMELMRVGELKRQIARYERKLNDLKDAAVNAGGIRYDKEAVKASLSGGMMERSVCEYVELEQKIERLKEILNDQMQKCETMLSMLESDMQRDILRMKYLEGKSIAEICAAVHRSKWTVRREEKTAIRRLES